MDSYDKMFTTIEEYKNITIEALQYSKIGKGGSMSPPTFEVGTALSWRAVMKKIATLEGIPRNDELKITDRASKLMQDVS
jgi:hypothetical protein